MLLSLKVQNYALIDKLFVEFYNGLNIITGETGAGKSILLGALGLILGKRADLGVLRVKEKKCVVEAEFEVKEYDLQALFLKNELDYEEHTVIRREIHSSGKSRAFINDTPVTLNVLQEVAMRLVDIHSQHQTLMLNKQDFLLGLIDRYCSNGELLDEYRKKFQTYKEEERKYIQNLSDYETIKKEFEFVNYQFKELDDANLVSGELGQLEAETEELENSGDIKTTLHEVEDMLSNEGLGICEQMSSILQKLGKISGVYSKGSDLYTRFDALSIELKDLQGEISHSFEHLDFDPQRFELVKERLSQINGLLLKYKKRTLEELIEAREELREKVTVAKDGGFDLEKQKSALDVLLKALNEKAEKLSEKRKSGFKGLEGDVLGILHEIGLGHSQVAFSHSMQSMTISGTDNINLHFSANKNHALQEVSKIASGGELSRLMLAIKAVLSKSSGMPTLILDEIDTGVSGEVASKVGSVINRISKGIQIINITHLPQVASKGNSHFLVYKDSEQEISRTLIKKLDKEERLKEIAKMLSGEELTEAALENARMLLGK